MKRLANLIAYFRACYQSDNRDTQIVDFLSKKLEFQLFLNAPELLQGSLDYFPVDSAWAAEATKNLTLYSKEKTLILGSFFLVGKLQTSNKIQNICAPLFINNVIINYSDELFTIELESEEHQLNPGVIITLQSVDDNKDNLYDILNEALPKSYIGFDELVEIESIINHTFSNVNTRFLKSFPALFDEKQIVEWYEKLTPSDHLYLLPTMGIGVLKKSSLSRGVLNELTEMSQENHYAAPLNELFLSKKLLNRKSRPGLHYIPANLSAAQSKIIDSIELNTSTLVIGPPGTGKSFTIATIAIDAISKGRSVLIAAKTDQAVDVIANKLAYDFNMEDLIVRGGRKDYKRKLKHKIENLLSGIGKEASTKSELINLKNNIHNKLKIISRLEQLCIEREKTELHRGAFLQNGKNNWIEAIRFWWIKKNKEQETPYWELVTQLEAAIEDKNYLVNEYVLKKYYYELHHTLRVNRPEFQKLNSALRARKGGKKELLFQDIDFQALYPVLPIWLVAAAEINNILPLYKEMFDVVIVDEATQCDIASALPLLYRAKKIVVVGDPKQLRHVSFLSDKRQNYLINKYEVNNFPTDILNYRENSLLDIIAARILNQSQVHFLDEHYRSLPNIISFSNQKFYNNALKIMTEAPSPSDNKNLELLICNGKRSKSGYNKIEADQVLLIINEIIEKENEIASHYYKSIGILSPFRAQVDYIRKLVEKQFSLDMLQRHNLLIGTPYSFQGEERDIMILSLTVDVTTHSSTLQYLNKEDVLNVAITRARTRQIVLISRDLKGLSNQFLFTHYLQHIYKNNNVKETVKPISTDQFAQEIITFLKKSGVTSVVEHHYLAGFTLDLVVLHQNNTIGIDLIGYPGPYQHSYQVEKYKLLSRMGITTVAIPFSSWVLQQSAVKEMLRKIIT